MDRVIVYPGAIPLDTDLLNTNRNTMKALGYVAQGMFGATTQVIGLACTPTSPASMSVNVAPGAISSLQVVDADAYGSLAADSTDPLVKMGINISTAALGPITPPSTSGQSQNFLVQAGFAETFTNPVALPYYDAANPSVPYTGPNSSGAAQNTLVTQTVTLQLVAGAPATTGSQTTPSPSSGFVGLYVITVANGQSSITAGNIAVYTGAPFVGGGSLQPGRLLNVQIFTTSGSYTPTVGANTIEVELVGGGGAGGGTGGSSSGTLSSGPGGGAGGYARKRTQIASLTLPVSVTVGAGGTGVTNGSGTAGGTSSFGSVLSATGGSGGPVSAATSVTSTTGTIPASGASGGAGAGGDINGVGGFGNYALLAPSESVSGAGGASYFGAGASFVGGTNAGTQVTANGANAVSPGSGGSGGNTGLNVATATKGGNGAAGIVIVREYS